MKRPNTAEECHVLVKAALQPEDLLNVGRVIYEGYRPANVVDLIYCANILLGQLLASIGRCGTGRDLAKVTREIRLVNKEIERLDKLATRALEYLSFFVEAA